MYRQFVGLQKQIQQAQNQLTMLNMFAAQKESALTIPMELQNRGVSTDEIYGLSKILDLDRLGKNWNYGSGMGPVHVYWMPGIGQGMPGAGVGQGNGSNGSQGMTGHVMPGSRTEQRQQHEYEWPQRSGE